MKIIKPGVLEAVLYGVCKRCVCVLECDIKEAIMEDVPGENQRRLVIMCPTIGCGCLISLRAGHAPYDPRKTGITKRGPAPDCSSVIIKPSFTGES